MTSIFIVIVVIAIGCAISTDIARATTETKPALEGKNVTLSCSRENLGDIDCNNNYIHWSKEWGVGSKRCSDVSLSTCLGTAEQVSSRFNVAMTPSSYKLHIANVQPSDGGNYICHTYSAYSQDHTDLHTISLHVWGPSCHVRPHHGVQIGDDVMLTCTLPIPIQLKWLAPNWTTLLSQRVTAQQQSIVLTVTVNEADNFEKFTCLVISPRGAYNPNCSVTPLKRKIVRISPEISHVREGDSVMCNCKPKLGPRKPHKYIYEWLINSELKLQGLNVSSYTVARVQLVDNATRVMCRASINDMEVESNVAVIYVYSTVSSSTRSYSNAETVKYGVTSKIPLSTAGHSINKVGYVTHNPGNDESKKATHVSFIAGGVVAIVFLFVLAIILVVILMKKKTRKNTTRRAGDTEVAAAGTPYTETTAQVADNPTREDDNTVIYALPLQKGGGNMKVRTLGVSFNTPSSSAAVTSATTSTLETTEVSMSLNDNTDTLHDDEALYALPSQKGGGNIKVRTLINKSSKKSSSSAEGRSSAANEADISTNSISNISDDQTSTATDDEILYALPSQKGGGYVKARTLDGASKKSSVSAAGSFSTVDEPSKTKPTIARIFYVQTIDTTESDEVVYALPTQKGGGSIKVRTLDGSSKKFLPSATTRSNEPDGHIATRATFPDSCGVKISQPSSTTKDDEVVYALPSQKGGGSIKVRTLDMLDGSSKKSSPSATTRSHQADGHSVTRATCPDSCGVQSAPSTTKDDEDLYALPSHKGGGHIKVRTLDASYRT